MCDMSHVIVVLSSSFLYVATHVRDTAVNVLFKYLQQRIM